MKYIQEFTVDSCKYVFKVINNVCTVEILSNPNLSSDKYDLHPSGSSFGSGNRVKNPLKVFRAWSKVLNQYLATFNPSIVYFTAVERSRRQIYSKLLKTLDNKYVGYPCTESGRFLIVRRNEGVS